MPKGRPFFVINDDQSNPINAKASLDIFKSGASGVQKGDSRSLDPEGKRYPKGFTPAVDFYINQQPMYEAQQVNLDSEVSGLFVPKNKKGGKNLISGRHVEYGNSITVETDSGSIAIDSAGQKTKTNFVGGQNPQITIDVNALSLRESFKDPNNLNLSTNSPVEYGTRILNQKNKFDDSVTIERLADRYQTYDNFQRFANKNFTHLLDFFIDSQGIASVNKTLLATSLPGDQQSPPDKKEIFLGTFLRTLDDNEDPTILGFDLELKTNNSPLLSENVAGDKISDFLNVFGSTYQEVQSRIDILSKFKSQLYKFIRSDNVASVNPEDVKSYYVKKISGLDNLTERFGSDTKQFIEYRKDLITLDFNEDVSQNLGYLATLYKALSYSRINGKYIIPENLLRFDIDITITEIRNYNRSFTDPNDPKRIRVYSDKISTYKYTLYECQFMFDKFPHGDEVDNSNPESVDKYSIVFNYKHSTMKFTKYFGTATLNGDGTATMEYYDINNLRKNLQKPSPFETTRNDGVNALDRIELINERESYPILPQAIVPVFNPDEFPGDPNEVGLFDFENVQTEFPTSIDDLIQSEKLNNASENQQSKSFFSQAREKLANNINFDPLKKGLANAAIREVNRQILTQAALLNKTIDNIRNSVGLGRMSKPNNVYTDTNLLRNDVINEFRNATANSVKGFFSKP